MHAQTYAASCVTGPGTPLSLHLLDPELAEAAQRPSPSFSHENLSAIRAGVLDELAGLARLAPPPAIDLGEESLLVETAGRAPVRVLAVRPAGLPSPLPAFLHVHGGGYVMGASASMALQARRMAESLGCLVLSVDYRIAPEAPYPGPLEDCYTVLQWMHSNEAELELDPHRIAIGGESAGAGLVAALALLARDRGGPSVLFQSMTAPMLDDRTVVRPPQNPWVGHIGWSPESNGFGWSAYLGDIAPGSETVPEYAAAARARDLQGLPPALIQVGALDLFLDECMEYARRLMVAGVPTELHVYPGAHHSFETWAPFAHVSLMAPRATRLSSPSGVRVEDPE